MKTKIILIILIIFLIFLFFINILFSNKYQVNTDFASNVSIKYHYMNKSIDLSITDINEINELKSILKGISFNESPSCGFNPDVSITFSDSSNSVTLCPACDGCPLLRINNTDRYIRISDSKRQRLNEVLKKYGATFPCI